MAIAVDRNKMMDDPLVVATTGAAVSAGFWAACAQTILYSTAAISPATIAVLGGINVLGLGAYAYSHQKEIFYEASLIYSIARNRFCPETYAWWNKIEDKLYLGAIPLHEANHLERILAEIPGPLAVLSILEPFELEDNYAMTRAVSPKEWAQRGVKTKQIASEDFQAVGLDKIREAIAFIQQMHEEGRTVYVHCKAGVGRSASVVACKLLQDRRFHSPQDVISHIQSIRPHVTIGHYPSLAAIEAFWRNL